MKFNLLKTRAGRALSGVAAIGSVAAIVAASTVMPAAAANTLLANGITSPTGILWLPGQKGGHWWVGDHAQGLCRLDPPAVAGQSATLTNCDLTVKSIGQPAFDPVNNFVYVPDNAAKSTGVWRLTFDPVNEVMGGGSAGGVFGGGTSTAPVQIAPNAGFAGNRPFAVAVDPNNGYALYVGLRKTPDIFRVATPNLGSGGQVTKIGQSSDGRQVRAMTMVTHVDPTLGPQSSLAVMDGNGVGFIGQPSQCTGSCKALVPAELANLLPLGVGSDNNARAGSEASIVYIPDTTGVLYQYNAVSGSLTTLATGLSFPTAAGVKANAALPTVVVGDDPSQGNSIGAGHIYQVQ